MGDTYTGMWNGGRLHEWTRGWACGWVAGWMDTWMDGWFVGWVIWFGWSRDMKGMMRISVAVVTMGVIYMLMMCVEFYW